jgi:hypothetical protein
MPFCVSAVIWYGWYLFSSFFYLKHLIPSPLSQVGSTLSEVILKFLCLLCAIIITTGSNSKLCFIHFITVKYKAYWIWNQFHWKTERCDFLKQRKVKVNVNASTYSKISKFTCSCQATKEQGECLLTLTKRKLNSHHVHWEDSEWWESDQCIFTVEGASPPNLLLSAAMQQATPGTPFFVYDQ